MAHRKDGYFSICLKPQREKSWIFGHPWIFSGAVATDVRTLQPGTIASVYDFAGNSLGCGYVHPKQTLCLRMLSKETIPIDADWIARKLKMSALFRQRVVEEATDAYRLCFGESDGLPGLVIDVYGAIASIEVNTRGMERLLPYVIDALQQQGYAYGVTCDTSSAIAEGVSTCERFPVDEIWAKENGFDILVPLQTGQKTGWFCDQRSNRAHLGNWVKRQGIKSVLNLFSYTGGFSLYALAAGALRVVNVDRDANALEIALRIERRNSLANKSSAVYSNVWDYLRREDEMFDLVIVDPPAFTKEKSKIQAAVRGYRDLFRSSLAKVKKGGSIALFSCSHFVTLADLSWAMRQVMQEVGRSFQTVCFLSQAPDHPIPLWFPESSYLKGILLQEITNPS